MSPNILDLYFLQWNVRSIRARLLDLNSLIVSYPCPILFLSETWLLPNTCFKLNNYHIYRSNRADGYGGSAIAILKGFQSRAIALPLSLSTLLLQHNINLVGVELFDSRLVTRSLSLWSIYIPPSSNLSCAILDRIFLFYPLIFSLLVISTCIILRGVLLYHLQEVFFYITLLSHMASLFLMTVHLLV